MFKAGIYTIAGRPNAGKSTLINRLVGEKVAIVSWRPQTTRDKIIGIVNGEGHQIVFVDTPGIHKARNGLSEYMMKSVNTALEGVDGVLYVVACDKRITQEDRDFIAAYSDGGAPLIVVLNKCDSVERKEILDKIGEISACGKDIAAIIPVSARTGKNVELITEEIVKRLPDGEPMYPEDMFTDKNLRFMCAELLREKAMRYLGDEIPYGIGVSVDKFDERDDGMTEIQATIVCDKRAHKPIVIGKGGETLKKISTAARKDMEELLQSRVYLEVWVKVKEEWRDSDVVMRELGYDKKELT